MKYDLKNLNRRQLERLRADIDKALERIATVEKKEALKAAQKAAKAHGFSLAELTGAKMPADAEPVKARRPRKAKTAADGRAKVAPKFANPNNPDEKWSGRGRPPKWMEAHIAAGGSKDDCLI